MTLGILYAIHGNLPALEAVLDEANRQGIERWLLGGDYGATSPWPCETLERLRALPNATWIRGNGERWLYDPPDEPPEVKETYDRLSGALPEADRRWLFELPERAELDGALYVHGSPRHGEPNAAWAVWREDGSFELRRTDYDTKTAAAAFRALGGRFGEFSAHRIETGSD